MTKQTFLVMKFEKIIKTTVPMKFQVSTISGIVGLWSGVIESIGGPVTLSGSIVKIDTVNNLLYINPSCGIDELNRKCTNIQNINWFKENPKRIDQFIEAMGKEFWLESIDLDRYGIPI